MDQDDGSEIVFLAATPEQQMRVLVSKINALTRTALDLTRQCVDINEEFPMVLKAHVDAAVARLAPAGPRFYHSAAPVPDELDKMFPPGYGDNIPWHVVCIGRRPGLYASAADADDQVRGVPNQSRKKKDSRQEVLAYYRAQYTSGECERVSEAPPTSHVAVEVVVEGPSEPSK
ncbi:hypothetical protein C8R45DRAFT_1102110 [Mycena sanguinolenta]|nr:hypothetical protein C8R45DRAFT_1102110 [Mycena sanguinolenta]